jgi:hypothetical protein
MARRRAPGRAGGSGGAVPPQTQQARRIHSAAPDDLFWADYDDERLLDVRMCDLGVRLEGSGLEARLEEVYGELAAKGLVFRPHVWLSDEWFCPDGVPGIAIPHYLAHPRLARLEQSQCLEVEGGTREWCLKILRHEIGHAIENAYKLRTLRKRRDVFGATSTPYPRYYQPKPYSRSFVVHLDNWYAQSHPDEDFAETFAVWLTPDLDWRARYAGWPALRKLEFVDTLMAGLAAQPPLVRRRQVISPLPRLKKTLRAHYRNKRRVYGLDRPQVYDEELKRIFTDSGGPEKPSAAPFIARIRPEIRRRVAAATGEYQYTIDRVIRDVIRRSRELGLRLARPEAEAKIDVAVTLTAQTMNYLASGRHRVAL